MTAIMISKEDAAAALRTAAFTIDDPTSDENGRTIVHCFMSFCGADWDLSGVERLIQRADSLAWDDNHLFGHPVRVNEDGRRIYHFQGERS